MNIAAHRGTRVHAPENSRQALISAYTAGADVLEFDVQMTKDHRLVVCHDPTLDRLTGEPGTILDLTLNELRHTGGMYDFSATFDPFESGLDYFRPGRRLQVEIFEQLIDVLPRDVQLLIELKHDSAPDDERRGHLVGGVLRVLEDRRLLDAVVLYSKDECVVRDLRAGTPDTKVALLGDWNASPDQQLARAMAVGAHGLVTQASHVVSESGALTNFAEEARGRHERKELPLGVILYPYRRPGTFLEAEFLALSREAFVWSISTDSMLAATVEGARVDVSALAGRPSPRLTESFGGKSRNRDQFSFGYAKANRFCEVFQDDGVHIKIDEYEAEPEPSGPADQRELRERIQGLERRLWYAERSWPFYSGGGFGLTEPIVGDFVAEVDYEVEEPMTQAVTLEMAVVNVDPGRHVSGRPVSFRDKDSFYDPHGCPPYVGVEHDEDDGYRINWNLGTEYDSNQYGPPVGDGATPQAGRLRLERRGDHFSAYYRNEVDAPDWICVGSIRNDSMNQSVFIRCSAKRWRQESSAGGYFPIQKNRFVFRNFTLTLGGVTRS